MSFEIGDVVEIVQTRDEMYEGNCYRGNLDIGYVGTISQVHDFCESFQLFGDEGNCSWIRISALRIADNALDEENWV